MIVVVAAVVVIVEGLVLVEEVNSKVFVWETRMRKKVPKKERPDCSSQPGTESLWYYTILAPACLAPGVGRHTRIFFLRIQSDPLCEICQVAYSVNTFCQTKKRVTPEFILRTLQRTKGSSSKFLSLPEHTWKKWENILAIVFGYSTSFLAMWLVHKRW